MKRDWGGAELSRWWSLNFDELALIETKPPRTRLGFVAQLKTYRLAGRFAEHAGVVAVEPVAYLAEQLAAAPSDLEEYDWANRRSLAQHRRRTGAALLFLHAFSRELLRVGAKSGEGQTDGVGTASEYGAPLGRIYQYEDLCRKRRPSDRGPQ